MIETAVECTLTGGGCNIGDFLIGAGTAGTASRASTPPQGGGIVYHGTSTVHEASIRQGINPQTGTNYGGLSQLGEGFYTTLENNPVARDYAIGAVGQASVNNGPGSGGRPVVLQIAVDERAVGIGVPKYLWWKNIPDDLINNYDFLVAPITGSEPALQMKFNPSGYQYLEILE